MQKYFFIISILSFFLNSLSFSAVHPDVPILLKQLTNMNSDSSDAQIHFIMQQLQNRPYAHANKDNKNLANAFDCQTLVQNIMALRQAKDLNSFENKLAEISYRDFDTNASNLSYHHLNHFVDGDFNPNNQRKHFLKDITNTGILAKFKKITSAIITRNFWLKIRGQAPVNEKKYEKETVNIAYIPKQVFLKRDQQGYYIPHTDILNAIQTPAVVEMIYNAKQFPVRGSQTSVGHMGIVYKHRFKKDEIIYQRINCHYDKKKICIVTPIHCQKNICDELMLAHATSAYPAGYYWYQESNGKFVCSPVKPKQATTYSSCNRVETRPLFDYLIDFQYGEHWYINYPPFLGLHFEKLTS